MRTRRAGFAALAAAAALLWGASNETADEAAAGSAATSTAEPEHERGLKAWPERRDERYWIIGENSVAGMEEALNRAGAAGYRYESTDEGLTGRRARPARVRLERDEGGTRYRYRVVRSPEPGGMDEELAKLPPEYEVVGYTIFRSRYRGAEVVTIAETVAGEE